MPAERAVPSEPACLPRTGLAAGAAATAVLIAAAACTSAMATPGASKSASRSAGAGAAKAPVVTTAGGAVHTHGVWRQSEQSLSVRRPRQPLDRHANAGGPHHPARIRTASAEPAPRAHRPSLLDDRTLRDIGNASRAERRGSTRD